MEQEAIQGLSEHYKDVIVQYFKFARHQSDLNAKEVESTFKSASARLVESSYTVEEVQDILNNCKHLVVNSVKAENQNNMHTVVELLRQVFKEVDAAMIMVKVDISKLENEENISKIKKLEENIFSQPKTAKLPSLGKPNQLSTELVTENDTLKTKLLTVQQQLTAMMKDKTNQLTISEQKVAAATLTIAELKETVEDLKAQLKEASTKTETVIVKEVSTAPVTVVPQVETKIDPALVEKVKTLEEQNKQLQEQVAKARNETKTAQKEAAQKLNESAQFKNMKKILSSKNDELKKLREKLSKYETVDGGDEDTIEDDE